MINKKWLLRLLVIGCLSIVGHFVLIYNWPESSVLAFVVYFIFQPIIETIP